ncbi:MAG: DedA family protein [Chitinophagaceae bacterium]|nr:DedA family protein [Chitinophagaceae bacterium]MCW5927914.1 DedA family protein [Chitinophagaceae bacterium]
MISRKPLLTSIFARLKINRLVMMELFDFIMHIDDHLRVILSDYGNWIYLILFAIIFVETGIVIMPFLPGDSLLFAAGMLAAQYPESLNIWIVIVLLLIAGISGDAVNYAIGRYFGMKVLNIKIFGKSFVKQEHLDKTQSFYDKYGPATIIIARFVPIVRTLAPFVGGVGKMRYTTFATYNVAGAFLWVVGLSLAGYYLGRIPAIRDNFSKVVLLIVFLSVLPIIFSMLKGWYAGRKKTSGQPG